MYCASTTIVDTSGLVREHHMREPIREVVVGRIKRLTGSVGQVQRMFCWGVHRFAVELAEPRGDVCDVLFL